MLTISFGNESYEMENESATLLADLIVRAGIMPDLRCGGMGICGRCQVELQFGEFLVDGIKITVVQGQPQVASACRTEVCSGPAAIVVPLEATIHADGQIAIDYEQLPQPQRSGCNLEIIAQSVASTYNWSLPAARELGQSLDGDNVSIWAAIPAGKTRRVAAVKNQPFIPLGVAIDIGTTTVAAVLVDWENNAPLASVSAYNRQAVCGDNVASRISYSVAPGGLEKLRRLIVVETINPLLRRLLAETNRKSEDIVKVSVTGNTVMEHLFLGISPRSIGTLPFLPPLREFPELTAAELGLAVNPAALVSLVPAIAGYIGGDLTAGIIASGQHRDTQRTLLTDIGTNCEIILCDGGQLYACAAAAGPAFEGAGIVCGSRAAGGAIDHIEINTNLQFHFTTIDQAPPVGLCGSAIIDFLAEGFRSGLIDAFGRYNLEMLRQIDRYLAIDYGHGTIHACVIARRRGGKIIHVSEADIEQVLKAKAAVYSGIQTLLEQRGLTYADLDTVYLAGGFARYLRVENAVTLGMLPPLRDGVYRKIGNSSLAGAVMNLIDPDFPDLAAATIRRPQTIELNTVPDFENHYIDALMIPNCNAADS